MSAQAVAPPTQPFGAEAFEASDRTVLRWLGMAGWLVNARGTTLMIDPLLSGFDMPIMIEMPLAAGDVPHLDAVLVTHSDNDHFSRADLPRPRAGHGHVPLDPLRRVADGAARAGRTRGTTSATPSTSDRCGSR